jgi:hypothetical protein
MVEMHERSGDEQRLVSHIDPSNTPLRAARR